eukprot:CAMPEP_0176499780 /NCGR_PEP_ID=MMETSP0200_2-20121128/13130_1 /TAXON_ID=947934 /ORGANISM="Chaetoceros sp., Strain GSL56" /LENGTH=678 /DNA_ID=CAMNT_0017898263 /DNA_START=88 /DNA_END=2124 /DNA_ORIENTATION=-
MQQSQISIHELIHLDDALERHLSTILDQESSNILAKSSEKAKASNDDASMSPEHDPSFFISDALSRIKSSDEYKNLMHEIKQGDFPVPPITNPRKVQPKSFSLFDNGMIQSSSDAGGGFQGDNLSIATSTPLSAGIFSRKFVNIRDILECHENLEEMLAMASGASVQDLILDFNTTQHEIELLADSLHRGLEKEFISDGQMIATEQNSDNSNRTYFGLHQKWFHECMMDEEALTFAFMLVRNVIMVSTGSSSTLYDSRLKYVLLIKEMMTSIIKQRWNDFGIFQREWFKLVYLWVRCSFQGSMNKEVSSGNIVASVHGAWAQVDSKGSIFSLCVKCINSTWMIQLLFIKTCLVEYIRSVLMHGFDCNAVRSSSENVGGDDALDFGSLLCHAISMLRTIIVHSSCMTLFHLKDIHHVYGDVSTTEVVPLTIATIENELCWIQQHEIQVKQQIIQLSMEKPLSNQDIQYIVAPFLVLMEIGLIDIKENEDLMVQSSHEHKSNQFDGGDEYLMKMSAECLIYILQSCGKSSLQGVFNQISIHFFGLASKILVTCSGRVVSLPLAVVEYVHVIAQVSSNCDWVWENENWYKGATTVVTDVLSPLVLELPVLQKSPTRFSFNAWNQIVRDLELLLRSHYQASSSSSLQHHDNRHHFMDCVNTLLSDYAKIVPKEIQMIHVKIL